MPAASRAAAWPRALALALLATATAATLGGCSHDPDDVAKAAAVTAHDVTLTPAQRKHIALHTVALGEFHQSTRTSGRVDFDAEQATSVLAPFSGPVTRLLVAPGDKVAKGQALAMVDSSDFAAAIGAYSKSLVAARNARRIADMDNDLVKHDGVSQREAAQANTDAASAEADRDAAKQALLSLGVDAKTIREIQAGRTVSRIPGVIRAPIAGTVVERLVSPGQLLQAGSTPCFTVADLSKVWVMAQVTPAELASVHVGDTAEVSTGTGTAALSGTITNIAGLVDSDTGLINARVALDNPHDLLKKQMYVNVVIRSHAASRGLLAPVSAVLRDDENLPFVYVAQKDGSFARQHVTPGSRSGDDVEITKGLKPGQEIVVDGGIFVQFLQNQ